MKHFCHEDDPRVAELRRKLDEFYATTTSYAAFTQAPSRPDLWGYIRQEAQERIARGGRCHILEFGAGRTGFGEIARELAPSLVFHVQDVTPQNQSYLAEAADEVFIGDIRNVQGSYDVIFSSYVWEHITNPRQTLDHLLGLLAPGGSLIIQSPRYDFPGYLSPSSRHYSRLKRLGLAAWLLWRRWRVRLGAKPDFLIHLDPALLHMPWFRDSDAIHWVSRFDLPRRLGAQYEVLPLPTPVSGQGTLRQRLLERLRARRMVLFVRIRRRCEEF